MPYIAMTIATLFYVISNYAAYYLTKKYTAFALIYPNIKTITMLIIIIEI